MAVGLKNTIKRIAVDNRPLYLRVSEAFGEILKDYSPGEKLPPESELAQNMGVSRATLREALRIFEERGMIASRHGVGTFVTGVQPVIDSGLEVLESLDSLAGRIGMQVSMGDLTISENKVDALLAAKFGLAEGDAMFTISRNRLKGEIVLAYMVDMIPACLTTMAELQADFNGSVLDFLSSRLPSPPSWALTSIQSVPAVSEVAKKMKIQRGTALLLMEEELHSSDNRVINYSRNYYLTSNILFHIIRRKKEANANYFE